MTHELTQRTPEQEQLLARGKELVQKFGLHHIFIIPDGNRRWARERGFPALEGHRNGAENIIFLLRAYREIGVDVLGIWGLSIDNLGRSTPEVRGLLSLFNEFLIRYTDEVIQAGVVVVHMGNKEILSQYSPRLVRSIEKLEEETKTNLGPYLEIALAYDGLDELTRAFNKATAKGIKELTKETIWQFLDNSRVPFPKIDLVIRTSGEMRISGGPIWQAALAEFVPIGKYFPDFNLGDFVEALEEFAKRERRHGR